MRKCPKCGQAYDDSWKLCLRCNLGLSDNLSIKETNPEIREKWEQWEKKPKPLLVRIIILFGYLLIVLGFAATLGASLQTINFNILLPDYILISTGVCLLSLVEWFERKKNWFSPINVFSILSFFFGFSGFMLATAKVANLNSGILEVVLMLSLCVTSIITGVYAHKAARNNSHFIGRPLFTMGVILSSIILLFASIYLIFEGFHIRIDLTDMLK